MKKRQTWIGSILVAGVALVTLLGPAGAQQEGARRGDSLKPVVTTYDKAPQPPVGAEGDAGSRGDLPGDLSNVRGRPATTTTPTGDDLGDDPSRTDDHHGDDAGRADANPRDTSRRNATGAAATTGADRTRATGDTTSGDVTRTGTTVRTGDVTRRGEATGTNRDDSVTPRTGTAAEGDGRDDAPGMRGDGRGSVEDESPRTGDSVKTVLPTYTRVPEAQNPTRAETRPSDLSNLKEEPRIGDDQKPTVSTYDKRPDPKGEAQDFEAVRYEERNEDNDSQSTELQMRVLEGSVVE